MSRDPEPQSVAGSWARLTAGVADRVLAATVQDMHRAISGTVFRRLGPVGHGVQTVHDRVTDGAYGLVRASIRGLGEVAAAVTDVRAVGRVAPPTETVGATKARAIAHGVVGADLLALAPALDQEVTVRVRSRRVETDADGLLVAYPDAGSHVVVFVHGLVDTEHVWTATAGVARSLPAVAAAAGGTPVLVRYGTGRAVARTGDELSRVLDQLVLGWPVAITRLTLVGHSMGGLVIRSALAAGGDDSWRRAVSDVVYLGTPHLGSWLEKVANTASWTLRLHTHSAPIGRLLDARSRGIKDLRFGTLSEEGWSGAGIDDLLTGRGVDPPFGAGVTHHLVVGGLGRSDRNAVRYAVGDALVRTTSARGAGRARRIAPEGTVSVVRVHGASHTGLIRHPDVADMFGGVLGG